MSRDALTKKSLMLLSLLSLFGCAGLEQFPQRQPLADLDPGYEEVLASFGNATTPEAKVGVRNQFIQGRMALIDANFSKFEKDLSQENVGVDFGVAVLGVGVGAAGALVSETASQILSAVSGGLAGAQAAYNKSALFDKTFSALLAQMRAGRKSVAAQIFVKWDDDIDAYPLWRARQDLDAYAFAGSLPGAIVGISADAEVKERQAAVVLREITPESVTDSLLMQMDQLAETVDSLEPGQAKNLLTKIKQRFPEISSLIERQYSDDVRSQDQTGADAKLLLKRLIELTVLSPADAAKWKAAIENL